MNDYSLNHHYLRKLDSCFENLSSLKQLRSNLASIDVRSTGWSSDTATTIDGNRVFTAMVRSLGSTFDTLATKSPYKHYIVDDFKNAFTNQAQVLKNQSAIALLQSWKRRSEGEINKTWEKAKAEIEEGALSNRQRFLD